MDPHPRPQQSSLDAPPSAFTASWTPSKAAVFDTNHVPVGKTHRAWERKPMHSVNENGKIRTVWKKYGLRSQEKDSENNTGTPAEKSPGRVVKKARVGSPVKTDIAAVNTRGHRKSSATRYERRKSGYRRKHAAAPATDAQNEDIMPATPEQAQNSTRSPSPDQHDEGPTHEEDQLSQPEENSMCEAAEAQLLSEAGLEPIPADFAISPFKKPIRAPRPSRSMRRKVAFQIEAPLVFPPQEHCSKETTPEDEDQDVICDLVQYPSLLDTGSPQESTISEEHPEDVESFTDSESSEPNETMFPSGVEEPLKPQSSSTSAPVSYPLLDIFGLDDVDVDSPQKVRRCDSLDDEHQVSDQVGDMFSISLNDETVNLGALLANNDSLSATITNDSIHLELGEQGEEEEDEDSSPTPEDMLEQREDDSPTDSPDELSLDLDTTETVTTTGSGTFAHLEDDKAKLSMFLQRVAAAKEKRSAIVSRRESLQNRRDSDVVRKALASPRPVLEEKDRNQSPQRPSQSSAESTLNLDQVLTSQLVKPTSILPSMVDDGEPDELSEMQTGSPRRRSSRTKSKLPQFSSQSAALVPNKISVRTDGGEKVNLNRTEAQQLADLVRRNTKKNKGTSIPAPARLAKIKLEALVAIVDGESPIVKKLQKHGVKNVTWREKLVDFATSTATADLEAVGVVTSEDAAAVNAEPKKKSGNGTPRLRRLKGLGGGNGTPAKNILHSIPLPDETEDDTLSKNLSATSANAKRKRSAASHAPTTTTDEPTPAAAEDEKQPVPQKRSKLPPPKKLNLNPSLASLGAVPGSGLPVLQGKENALFAGLNSPAKKMSKIPAPSGIPGPAPIALDLSSGLRLPVKRARSAVAKKV